MPTSVPSSKTTCRIDGKHSDRVLRTKQGAVFGAVLQFLQGHSCPQKKLVKHKRTAVCFLRGRDDARSKNRAPQPGAALRFLQAPSAARRKNRLSARGSLCTINCCILHKVLPVVLPRASSFLPLSSLSPGTLSRGFLLGRCFLWVGFVVYSERFTIRKR